MSSLRSSLVLFALNAILLVVGAFLFHVTECPSEISRKRGLAAENTEMEILISRLQTLAGDLLVKGEQSSSLTYRMNQDLPSLMNRSKIAARSRALKEAIECDTWSVYNSFHFSLTTITTIGYGTVAPVTPLGRAGGSALASPASGYPSTASSLAQSGPSSERRGVRCVISLRLG